jgi:hypothetical protein
VGSAWKALQVLQSVVLSISVPMMNITPKWNCTVRRLIHEEMLFDETIVRATVAGTFDANIAIGVHVTEARVPPSGGTPWDIVSDQ